MLFRRFVAVWVLLLLTPVAQAAYWVIDFTGDAGDYVVRRGETELVLEKLMVLHAGDTVIVKVDGGWVTLVDQANTHQRLTFGESPFIVPDTEPSPDLFSNVHEWVESWWSTRGSQSTRTTAAVSKGDLDPVIAGTVGRASMLLAGERSLRVPWYGGMGLVDIRLLSSSGDVVSERKAAAQSPAQLPRVSLEPGTYTLEATAGGPVDAISLNVVTAEQLPELGIEVLATEAPEIVRLYYLTQYLSTVDSWRFEAVQIAWEQEFLELVDRLESDR